MASESSPSQNQAAGARHKTLGLGGFVIELLLPTTLSAALLLAAARYLPWWDLHGRLGIGSFGVLLVALSLVLSIWVDGRTIARRQKAARAQRLNRADAKSRLVKFVLGGVVVPLAAFGAANLMTLPNRRKPMAMAAELTVKTPENSREEQIGSTVLRARDSAVKVAGIAALQASSSTEALNQLFRVLAEDPTVLKEGVEARALSRAIASYGKLATPRLIGCFSAASHGASTNSPPGRDAVEVYFGAGFEAMRSEVGGKSVDAVAKAEALSRLQAVEAQLRRSLEELDDGPRPRDGAGLSSLVMQTLLEMSPVEATGALAFARRVAADSTYADGVRGRALLLLARVGEVDDMDLLYGQLSSPSPLLQTRTLQAIAAWSARQRPGDAKAADRAER